MLIETPLSRDKIRINSTVLLKFSKQWAAFEIIIFLFLVFLAEWPFGVVQKHVYIWGVGFVTITSIFDIAIGLYEPKKLGLVWRKDDWLHGIAEAGFLIASIIWLIALATGFARHVPFENLIISKASEILGCLAQQFLLQSYFFVRMEKLVGEKQATRYSALCFSWVHSPNLPLMAITFIGGYLTNKLFIRYRSIYPLGLFQGLVGAALPLFFHLNMRVVLSYVRKVLNL